MSWALATEIASSCVTCAGHKEPRYILSLLDYFASLCFSFPVCKVGLTMLIFTHREHRDLLDKYIAFQIDIFKNLSISSIHFERTCKVR